MTPANLSLSLTRGITFGPILFLFSSKILGIVTVNTGQNYFTCPNHDIAVDTAVRFKVTGGELPGGIDVQIVYYVIANGLTADTFKVSETLGGSEVNLDGTGSGTQEVIEPADMTDWLPFAEVRTEPEATVILDLQPMFLTPEFGVLEIP